MIRVIGFLLCFTGLLQSPVALPSEGIDRLIQAKTQLQLEESLNALFHEEAQSQACFWEKELSLPPCHCYPLKKFDNRELDRACLATVQRQQSLDQLLASSLVCSHSPVCLQAIEAQIEILKYQDHSKEMQSNDFFGSGAFEIR